MTNFLPLRAIGTFGFAALMSGNVPWASAETCKYVDKEQRVVYSNVPVEGARKVLCFDPTPPAPKIAPPAAAGKNEAASEETARVEPQTQRKRDQERRNILEKELSDEQQRLADARKDLADGEGTRLSGEKNYTKYLDRIQQLRDNVSSHERNVQAISTELANLR